MRTKDELFRAAQREVAAYRQQAVMQAETARRAGRPLARRLQSPAPDVSCPGRCGP